MSFVFEKKYGLLIGGQWVDAENGATFKHTILQPTNCSPSAQMPVLLTLIKQ